MATTASNGNNFRSPITLEAVKVIKKLAPLEIGKSKDVSGCSLAYHLHSNKRRSNTSLQ